jgi:hypothetical protein
LLTAVLKEAVVEEFLIEIVFVLLASGIATNATLAPAGISYSLEVNAGLFLLPKLACAQAVGVADKDP